MGKQAIVGMEPDGTGKLGKEYEGADSTRRAGSRICGRRDGGAYHW
ncbi:hypothetical protein Tco_0164068, partial [Tanacetum coccineum]